MVALPIQRRGGNSAAHATFTGLQREATIDTDKWAWRLHDGATAGGFLGGGYKRSDTGSVLRSMFAKVGDVVSIKDFGAKGDGVTDDTAALNAAIAAVLAAGGYTSIYVPPSSSFYMMTSQIAITLAANKALRIFGDTASVCELRWTNATGGFAITYQGDSYWIRGGAGETCNGFVLDGMAWTTTRGTSAGTALSVVGTSVEGRPQMETAIRNSCFRGGDGAGQWQTCIDFLDVADTRVDNVDVIFANASLTGTGINYRATSQATSPTAHFISGYKQYYGGSGILAGNYVEGIHIQNAVMVGPDYGIHWPTTTAESMLAIRGSHIAARTACIYMKNVHDSEITGNLFLKHGGTSWTSVLLDGCGRSTVTGNVISGAGANAENGIVFSNNVTGDSALFNTYPSIVSGNLIANINGGGIWLQANTGNVHIADNHFSAVNTRVINDGPKTGNARSTNAGRIETALISLSSNQTLSETGSDQTVSFNHTHDDTGTLDAGGSIVSGAALVAPPGKSRARLTGQVTFAGSSTLRYARVKIRKNGADDFAGQPEAFVSTDGTSQQTYGFCLNIASGWINVVPGDAFTVTAYFLNDLNNLNIVGSAGGGLTWLSAEFGE